MVMLKFLKWDFIKWLYRFRYILLVYLTMLCISYIVPAFNIFSGSFFENVLPPLFAATFLILSYILLFYTLFSIVIEIRKFYRLTEALRGRPVLCIFSGTIINIFTVLLSMGMLQTAKGIIKKYVYPGGLQIFDFQVNETYLQIFLHYSFVIPTIILFLYLLIFTRSNFNIGLTMFLIYLIIASVYNSIKGFFVSTLWVSVITGLIAVICFFLSCRLYDQKYEPGR